MTDENEPAAGAAGGTAGARAEKVQLALVVLTCILASAFVVLAGIRIVHPETLSSGRAEASRAQDRDEELQTAARKAALAFLDVDYRDMDPRLKKVLSLSTGTFKKEYQNTSVALTAAARQGEAISTGKVRYIGIDTADEDSAVLFVAADQTVTNKAIEAAKAKGENPDTNRLYRFKFNMTRVGDRWLLSQLQAVG